jgi:hypothetical protein
MASSTVGEEKLVRIHANLNGILATLNRPRVSPSRKARLLVELRRQANAANQVTATLRGWSLRRNFGVGSLEG